MKIMLGLYIRKYDRLPVISRNVFNFVESWALCFINFLLQTFIAFLAPLSSIWRRNYYTDSKPVERKEIESSKRMAWSSLVSKRPHMLIA